MASLINNSDLHFLKRTVILSRLSLEKHGFPVAAVLVRNDDEIAYGLTSTESTSDVTAHGEVQAIRAAGKLAKPPLTLYSSLEPCLMCLAASAWAGVNRIVFGCRRAAVNATYYESHGNAQDIAKLLVAPPQILFLGDHEDEVISLIRQFESRL